MISKRAAGAWTAINFVLCLALWLVSCGRFYLQGPPLRVLEGLCQGLALTSPQDGYPLYYALSWSPLDPILTVSLFQAALLVASFALLWLCLSKVWSNPVSPTLCCGLLFFGGENLWLLADSPEQTLGVLFQATAVGAIVAAKVPILCGAVMGVALIKPAQGVTLLLVLAYLAHRRQEAYGIALTVVSVVGTSLLLVGLVGDYQLSPAFSGCSLWSLLPIAATALSKELRESRMGLYSVLLVGSVATGAPELASAICLGDVFLLALRLSPGEPENKEETDDLKLSLKTLTHLAAVIALIAAVLKGEQYLNRGVLIPSQKQKIALHQLLRPFSLQDHARRVKEGNWKPRLPLPSLGAAELQAADKLSGPFRVLTLDSLAEERKLSLALALYRKLPLQGWSSPSHLGTSSLTCKAMGKNVIVDSTVLFRQDGEARVESGPTLPKDSDSLAEISFRELWDLPYRTQTLSRRPGAGYKLTCKREKAVLFFPEERATVVFSATPDEYLLSPLNAPEKRRKATIHALKLALISPNLEMPLPSRSLADLDFKITNRGGGPISSRELESVTLGVREGASFSPVYQEWGQDFVLFPEETTRVKLTLPTPATEGTFELVASYRTADGTTYPLPIEGTSTFKTWRRLAPVGTWVEEP